MMSRRTMLAAMGGGAAVALAGESPKPLVPEDLESNIDRGLFSLQRLQKQDGSFDSAAPPAASVALVILAMLASGHTPDLGKYGQTVRMGLEWLLAHAGDKSYFGDDGGRMYGHAIATLALSQLHGLETDEATRRKTRATLDKATKLILAAQESRKERDSYSGGWRYEPGSADADLSVTAWCVAALRACQLHGWTIPRDRFERAAAFAMRCYRPDRKAFAYQPQQEPSPAMTAAGILCLAAAEGGGRAEASSAAQFLVDNPLKENSPYLYYSLYYTMLVSAWSGEKILTAVWRHNLALLKSLQRKDDGAFSPRGGNEPARDDRPGRLYPTAMGCLALAVPLRLLPVFQR